ncbi:MAG: DUF2029 domain-containing protein, partial [Methylobacteriaceae bacterium]|nr:DUF2029 domain-containing protein [Methylobacteriaceae bacterium]
MPTDPQRPHGSDTRMNAVVIGGIVCILLAVIHMQTSGFAAAVDPAGLPKVDFLAFWAAGRAANEGALADVYNSAKLLEMEHRIIPVDNFYMPFLNPPPFLALAQILASVTFVTSLQLWMAVCAGVYLAAAWRLFPNRYAFLAAAFFPPFLWSLLIGQMTGLTAVMTVAALLNLEKRPALAGMLIGLLIFKPQGAVLIPVALAASRNWKAFGFAAGTVALLVLLSLGLYGPSLWLDFSGQL